MDCSYNPITATALIVRSPSPSLICFALTLSFFFCPSFFSPDVRFFPLTHLSISLTSVFSSIPGSFLTYLSLTLSPCHTPLLYFPVPSRCVPCTTVKRTKPENMLSDAHTASERSKKSHTHTQLLRVSFFLSGTRLAPPLPPASQPFIATLPRERDGKCHSRCEEMPSLLSRYERQFRPGPLSYSPSTPPPPPNHSYLTPSLLPFHKLSLSSPHSRAPHPFTFTSKTKSNQ